jgi:hypothetical protein
MRDRSTTTVVTRQICCGEVVQSSLRFWQVHCPPLPKLEGLRAELRTLAELLLTVHFTSNNAVIGHAHV